MDKPRQPHVVRTWKVERVRNVAAPAPGRISQQDRRKTRIEPTRPRTPAH